MRYKVGNEEYPTLEYALARAEQEACVHGETVKIEVFKFDPFNMLKDDRDALEDLMSRSFFGCIDPSEQRHTVNSMAANERLWSLARTIYAHPDGTQTDEREMPF